MQQLKRKRKINKKKRLGQCVAMEKGWNWNVTRWSTFANTHSLTLLFDVLSHCLNWARTCKIKYCVICIFISSVDCRHVRGSRHRRQQLFCSHIWCFRPSLLLSFVASIEEKLFLLYRLSSLHYNFFTYVFWFSTSMIIKSTLLNFSLLAFQIFVY